MPFNFIVFIIESVTMNYRDNAGTFLMIGFTVGYALLAPMAYRVTKS